ncbi:hypothetical protein [Actinomadura sp. 7K507]|uniref:hypothetical protein n=1 Tax=Actinomadura sp. 7K507 TaxID=2530365 RepID=UPI001042D521|nr:hypothetical protein [Actinomadura sp. 7K507]TDC84512.1 hypothetical protein E1285_26635 [Actinomadura sp. 7K507]
MNRPSTYAQRVRARPYGPREIQAGGVTVWFHGPFAVLTLTGETTLTLRADLEEPPISADLADLFSSAGNELAACLPHPGLLVCEQPLSDDTPNALHRFAVRPESDGLILTLEASGRTIHVALTVRDADRLAEEILRWAAPR